jgi:hypothetical protein
MDPPDERRRSLDLEERIRTYAHYFALIQKQHDALDREDIAEVISLADERERLAGELPSPGDLAGSSDPDVQRLVSALKTRIAEGARNHEVLVKRMKAVRSDLATEIGGLDVRTGALRAYIREDAPTEAKRVDLRF